MQHLDPFFLKYSASRHAFVFESSPPITTNPSKFKLLQNLRELSNSSGFSILSQPDLIISKPPMFQKPSIYSFSISMNFPLMIPQGPSRNPYSFESLWIHFMVSYIPEITLCPPEAWPPDNTHPTQSGVWLVIWLPFSVSGLISIYFKWSFVSSSKLGKISRMSSLIGNFSSWIDTFCSSVRTQGYLGSNSARNFW